MSTALAASWKKCQKIFQKALDKARFFCYNNTVAWKSAAIAQSVEHVIGNDEVIGPNPISSSKVKGSPNRVGPFGLFLKNRLARFSKLW